MAASPAYGSAGATVTLIAAVGRCLAVVGSIAFASRGGDTKMAIERLVQSSGISIVVEKKACFIGDDSQFSR